MERRSFLFVVFRSFSFRTALDTWLHIRCHHTTHVIETDRLTDTGALSHVTSLGTPVSHFGSVITTTTLATFPFSSASLLLPFSFPLHPSSYAPPNPSRFYTYTALIAPRRLGRERGRAKYLNVTDNVYSQTKPNSSCKKESRCECAVPSTLTPSRGPGAWAWASASASASEWSRVEWSPSTGQRRRSTQPDVT
jgi:hypothetical protein